MRGGRLTNCEGAGIGEAVAEHAAVIGRESVDKSRRVGCLGEYGGGGDNPTIPANKNYRQLTQSRAFCMFDNPSQPQIKKNSEDRERGNKPSPLC